MSVFTMATTLNQSTATTASPVTSVCLSESYDMWTCYGGRLVLLPLLMVVGVPGNILVLLVYSWRFPASTFREFVRVLALVDLTSNLVAIPLELLRALSNPGSTPAPFVAPAISYDVGQKSKTKIGGEQAGFRTQYSTSDLPPSCFSSRPVAKDGGSSPYPLLVLRKLPTRSIESSSGKSSRTLVSSQNSSQC